MQVEQEMLFLNREEIGKDGYYPKYFHNSTTYREITGEQTVRTTVVLSGFMPVSD